MQVGGTGGAADREARELRIGRLQRQKVRVSRKRILESATKVRLFSVSLEDVFEEAGWVHQHYLWDGMRVVHAG
jgi:hypothetical protein